MITGFVLVFLKTVVLPAVSAGFTWLTVEASKWVRAKTGSETAATSLTVIDDIVGVVVKELQQTRAIPEKLSNDGPVGKLSIGTATSIKQEAVGKVQAYLGTAGLEKMVAALNIDKSKAVSLIESKIEAAVWHTKNGPPAGTQPDTRLPPPAINSASTAGFAPMPTIEQEIAAAKEQILAAAKAITPPPTEPKP